MTKQEFESRYGKEVSEQMFDNINALYVGAGDMDKDTFVKDYKEHEESALLQVYFEKSEKQGRVIDGMGKRMKSLADYLIARGSELHDEDMIQQVEFIYGERYVIRRKIALHIELEDSDLAYVSEHLR